MGAYIPSQPLDPLIATEVSLKYSSNVSAVGRLMINLKSLIRSSRNSTALNCGYAKTLQSSSQFPALYSVGRYHCFGEGTMTRTALKLKECTRREAEQRSLEFSTVTYDQRN